jgi:hypothetical protein
VASSSVTPARSVAWVIIDTAGISPAVIGPPSASTMTRPSASALWGRASAATSGAPVESPNATVVNAPRRSMQRPTSGASRADSADAATNAAPTAHPGAPKWAIRSGSSAVVAPNRIASSVISHAPRAKPPAPSAPRSCPRISPAPGRAVGSGSVHVQPASATARAPVAQNTVTVPTRSASVPSSGPTIVPIVAAPIAPPIAAPRRCTGACAITQVRPPPQISPQNTPCTRRRRSSASRSGASAKPTTASPKPIRPVTVVRRTP